MKNRTFGFLAIVLASFVSFFGFTPEARAGVSNDVEFSGGGTLGGFSWSYRGNENNGWGDVHLNITSSTHAFTWAHSQFWTDPNDPSEVTAYLTVAGILNHDVTENSGGFVNYLVMNGVGVRQASQIDYWPANQYGPASNFVFVSLGLSPFDLRYAWMDYHEYFDQESGFDRFYFVISAFGSFGDGPEGDARGMAFRAVPTPGATALFGLSGLALLRRLRRR